MAGGPLPSGQRCKSGLGERQTVEFEAPRTRFTTLSGTSSAGDAPGMRLTTWSGDDTTASAVASPAALASACMSGSVIMRRIAADSFLMCRARRVHFFWTTRFFWLG